LLALFFLLIYKKGMTKPLVLALDGLSATGKGTLGRRLAGALDLAYLDTGLLYRAVGLSVLKAGEPLDDPIVGEKAAQNLDPASLDDPALRSDEVASATSQVSVHPQVRAALLKFQQDFAALPPEGKKGAVLDGRDIGTVIVPDAKVKLFVTASDEVRAHRRFLELQGVHENATEATVLAEMKARDMRDQTRAIAPAVPAEDAIVLDTSSLNADEVFKTALAIVREKLES